ncbi:MAG: hypothetical protein U0269_15635 [Polyangiales bacterium]
MAVLCVAACAPAPSSSDAAADSASDTRAEDVARDAAVSMDAAADGASAQDASSPDANAMEASAVDASGGDAIASDGGAIAVDSLSSEIANSVCAALFRCCPSATDLETYFAPYVASSRLDAVRMRLPPNVSAASFTEAACRAALVDAFAITPWGDWISAARAGRVQYDGAQAAACRDAMASASCGRPVWNALTDPRCFGFAPGTGDVTRSFFRRTATAGAACSFVRDGVGGLFFGTCDPTQAFCCYDNGGRCTVAPSAMLPGAMGTCRAASAVGEQCTIAPSLRVCRTGLECNVSGRCEAPRTAALTTGASCWNASDGLLGTCPATDFCDLFGSNRCTTLRADGASCAGGDGCRSGFCSCPMGRCLGSSDGGSVELGQCAPWGLCTMR